MLCFHFSKGKSVYVPFEITSSRGMWNHPLEFAVQTVDVLTRYLQNVLAAVLKVCGMDSFLLEIRIVPQNHATSC